jgi:hypothetical protein
MRARLERLLEITTLTVAVVVLVVVVVPPARSQPLSVHVRQANLYGGTLAQVRVYTTIRGPGTATIQVEPLDTRLGNWATEGPATTARVRLHRGRNRIHETLSVQMLESRFCAWRIPRPECPYLTSFLHPYLRVPVPFDRVVVTVAKAGIRPRDRIASVHQLNGAAAASTAPRPTPKEQAFDAR